MIRNYFTVFITILLIIGCAGKEIKRGDSFTNFINMEFIYIEPGEFIMGSPLNEKGRDKDENQRKSIIEKGFYLQTTEVTQGHWQAIMGSNPAYFKDCGDECPVENVPWSWVQNFIKRLNQIERSHTYRLPTEQEWEYACRAGSYSAFHFGNSYTQLDQYAWFSGNSEGRTHPVGTKKPNGWGLHDMYGNVWEWTQSCYHYYAPGTIIPETTHNPTGCSNRYVRGGSWVNNPLDLRSANRYNEHAANRHFGLGFRLVREP